MMLGAHVALLVLLVPVVTACAYLGVMALLSLLPSPIATPGRAQRRFVIVVPAHNEAAMLPRLLASLRELDYPADRYRALVIADNCDDATAEIGRHGGADVIERCDAEQVGKGYALAYALERITVPYDAIAFVDADCVVSPNLLLAFDAHLTAGASVVQAYYTMTAPASSATALARALALELVHRVRPRAKRWFGGSAGLKGSGMCFSREAINAAGWSGAGIVEDIDQHVALLRRSLRVVFAGEATVVGDAPARLTDAAAQHRRWEAGRVAAVRAYALALVLDAVRRRSLAPADAAAELLVPPVSLLGLSAPLVLAGSMLLGDRTLIAAAVAALGCLAFYMLAGLAFLRPRPAELVRCGMTLPLFMLWKTALYARAVIRPVTAWERTPRSE
jgi:cellulose synthase/poly-beta-1,6-N-acetylglucosamine synthase-like glycosyltransferase